MDLFLLSFVKLPHTIKKHMLDMPSPLPQPHLSTHKISMLSLINILILLLAKSKKKKWSLGDTLGLLASTSQEYKGMFVLTFFFFCFY